MADKSAPLTSRRSPSTKHLIWIGSALVGVLLLCLLCSGIGVVLAVFNVGRFSQPAVVGNWKSLEDEGGMEFKKDGTGAFHNSPNAPRPPNRGNVPRPDPPATVAFTWRIEAEQEPVLIIESQRQIRFHFHRDGNTLTLTPLQGGNWLRPIVMRKK